MTDAVMETAVCVFFMIKSVQIGSTFQVSPTNKQKEMISF